MGTELNDAVRGFAIGTGGLDGSAGVEGVAVPTVELRLIYGQFGLLAGDDLRPCWLIGDCLGGLGGGRRRRTSKGEQTQHQHE